MQHDAYFTGVSTLLPLYLFAVRRKTVISDMSFEKAIINLLCEKTRSNHNLSSSESIEDG